MAALVLAVLLLALALAGSASSAVARVNRAVYRIVGCATPLAVGALLANVGVIGGVS